VLGPIGSATNRRAFTAAGSYSTNVSSISFNPSSTLLSLTRSLTFALGVRALNARPVLHSDTQTVHVFQIADDAPPPAPTAAQSAAATLLAYTASVLPTALADMMEPSRNFAHITLKDSVAPTLAAFCANDILLVCTAAGYLYRFARCSRARTCREGEQLADTACPPPGASADWPASTLC
jgi:hypothetical protein